ncbi:MAG: chloromuconate cycloisomerase [Planctomycetota bacterium]|nr:chloromuconate cycloisomerase [Planctomycetota bacterium]
MPIRIASIDCRVVEHPLRPERLVRSALGLHDRSQFLIVRVTDADGREGWGEAATTPLWSGESAQTALWAVQALFAPRVIGAALDHPREALALMDGTTVANPFAKSALDTAVWDIWARTQNSRVAELFADRAVAESIPTRASVGCYDVAQTLQIAHAFWDAGVRTIKFKIGVSGFEDVARLKAVRDELGDTPVFTVDANGGYLTEDHAVRAIEELLPFNLALVEQPTPRDRISLLARVRRRVKGVPILIDEGVFTPDHLSEALDLDAFDLLSIYPGKNGGFTRSIDMAKTAQRAGKPCAIGSNLETDLGQAAMATLAASLSAFPVETLACDLPASLFYPRSSVDKPLAMVHGRVRTPTGHGFGVRPVY